MKALVMISTRFDTNANRSVAGPIISAREYLKSKGTKVSLDYDLVPFWFSHDTESSFSNEFLNVRSINEIESILQIYSNYILGHGELISGVDLKFYQAVKDIYDKYNQEIPYDYFLVSSYDSFLVYDLLAIFLVKQNNPHIKTVLGGNITMYYPEFNNLFKQMDGIDYVINGDIETSLELLFHDNLKPGYSEIPSVNMNELAPPIYNKNDVKLSEGYLALAPYRGCPFSCNFCTTAHLPIRETPLDNFLSWVELNKHGHTIHLNSPTINFSKTKFDQMLDGLLSIQNGYRLQAWARIEYLDPEVVEKMHQAKFDNLFIGIDSFFSRVRKKQNKAGSMSEEHVIKALDACMKKDMHISIAFVRNFPSVTYFENTIEYAFYKKIRDRYPKKNVRIRNYSFTLTLGSPIQKNPEKFGIEIEYWKNPYRHLPEFDSVVEKIPKDFKFIEPQDETQFPWDDEDFAFDEYKTGYVPNTEFGDRWLK